MGQKLSNIRCLVDKTMTRCESCLTKTYLRISGASSCRCIGIVGCLHYNRGSFTRFLRSLWLFGNVKWGEGIKEMHLKWLVFLIKPLYFDWYVVRWGSRSKHRKGTCLKEIGLRRQIWVNYSTLHSEHNWEDLCIQLRNQQLCTSDNHSRNQGRSYFQCHFCICFVANLPLQHEFCCVNMIGKCWRTWKTDQLTPTCLIGLARREEATTYPSMYS